MFSVHASHALIAGVEKNKANRWKRGADGK